jgi:hypothetical protein
MLSKNVQNQPARQSLASWLRRLFSGLFARGRMHQTFTIRGGAGTD